MADYDLLHDGEELDACVDEVQAARGSEASLSARLAAIVSDFETDQQRQETEIGAVAALGAKNVLLVTGTASTVNSVAYTVNEDGTITANGQASSYADWYVNSSLHLEPGTYKLTGCPAGGNNSSTYKIQIQGVGYDTGDGFTFTVASAINVNVYIRVWSGYNASNLVFKPMIRRAEITDDTFEPYAPTNRELYETKTEQTETNVIANLGAKNILTPTLTSESTKEGITCTPNPDGTFTLNGTFPTTSSETNVYFVVVNNEKMKELSNKYGAINVICSGGSDIERSQGRLRFYKIDTNRGTYDSTAKDKEISLTLSDNIMDSSANISIVVYRGQTLNNVVIRPMIRRAEITESSFKPYAPTNRELYEMILALQSGRSLQSSPASLMQAGRIGAELTDAGTDESEEEER